MGKPNEKRPIQIDEIRQFAALLSQSHAFYAGLVKRAESHGAKEVVMRNSDSLENITSRLEPTLGKHMVDSEAFFVAIPGNHDIDGPSRKSTKSEPKPKRKKADQ